MIWTPSGQLSRIDYANGTSTDFGYDPQRLWLESSTVTGPSGTLYESGYLYQNNSLIAQMSYQYGTADPATIQYGYDELSRLKTELRTVPGEPNQTQDFKYDAIGNMIYNSQVGNYDYFDDAGDPQHVHAVQTAGPKSFTYDANGNLLTQTVDGIVTKSLTWDGYNRVKQVVAGLNTTTYAYDSEGQRVRKIGPSGTSLYFGSMVELVDTVQVNYYYAGLVLVAKKELTTTPTVYYYHADHLGSTRLMTTDTGATANTYDYAAFGETTSQSVTAENERGFTGHITDPDVGLIYMNARYYDATIGRFISADSIVPDPTNPQALNRFSYCYNNPISNVDPTGNEPFTFDFDPYEYWSGEDDYSGSYYSDDDYYFESSFDDPGYDSPSSSQPLYQPSYENYARNQSDNQKYYGYSYTFLGQNSGSNGGDIQLGFRDNNSQPYTLLPNASIGNTQVFAVNNGVVDRVGWERESDHSWGFGWRIYIRTEDGGSDLYGHMDPSLPLWKGLEVRVGDYLGKIATEPPYGWSTRPHLDFRHQNAEGKWVYPGDTNPLPGSKVTTPFGVYDSTHSVDTHPRGHQGIDYAPMKRRIK